MVEDDFPVAHPRGVVATISQYGKEIVDGLAVGRGFENPNVSPSPCGNEYNAKQVPGRNVDLDTWWVGYSPYSEGIITYIEVPDEEVIGEALTRLKAVLEGIGWRTVEFGAGSPTSQAVLRIAAPQEGYGAVLQGITSVPGSPRIGVNISSPCLRHPEAR
ncbi:hypothetical protein [Actinocorallia aurantiaca]|uniref:Uncharacterized protein n=1 Tax=Actinocorallia aurantiaca TaxID=46204 RepID=A0ABN3U095_9ACTN